MRWVGLWGSIPCLGKSVKNLYFLCILKARQLFEPAVGGSHPLEGNLLVAVEVDTQTHLTDPDQIGAKYKMEG